MFFTTSDLLQRLNSSISDSIGEESPSSSGFELQRQMPDGSYRRAEERELAAANFQTKMKQVRPPRRVPYIIILLLFPTI